jgi:hypothetical protein
MAKWLVAVALVVVAVADSVDAQTRWGLTGGFTPSWKFLQPVADLIDKDVAISGAEFEAGVVRGREEGGEWGLSFVRKNVKNGSFASSPDANCYALDNGPETCLPTTYTPIGVSMQGVELHTYIPFVTIKRRVQLGMNLAGGVGKVSGAVEERRSEMDFVFDPVQRQMVPAFFDTVETNDIKEMLAGYDIVPLAKVELAAAVLVAPGLKVRVSGGFNVPGYRAFGVTSTFLFGRR